MTFFRLPVAADMILRPVTPPPVKATLSTPLLAASVEPTGSPAPSTRLAAPGGKPASSINSNKRTAETGVISDGFKMHALPAASPGASFHTAMSSG